MAETLRERQKKIAREAILNALAEEVAEIGSLDFAVGDVAKRAGVSHRTVYNYFGSRQDLIEAFADWTDETIHEQGGLIVPERVEDLPVAVRTNFAIFEERSDIAEVLARMDTTERATEAHSRRNRGFVDAIAAAYPEMGDRQRKMVAALMRQIASVRTWYYMTNEHGLSTEEAGIVSSWALEHLKASLDGGDIPKIDEGE